MSTTERVDDGRGNILLLEAVDDGRGNRTTKATRRTCIYGDTWEERLGSDVPFDWLPSGWIKVNRGYVCPLHSEEMLRAYDRLIAGDEGWKR